MINLCSVLSNKKEILISIDDMLLIQEADNNSTRITFKQGLTITIDAKYISFRKFFENRSGVILTEFTEDKVNENVCSIQAYEENR